MFNFEDFKVFFCGKFVDFKDANISIANTTFLYGLGVFTGMRAHFNEENDKLYIFRPLMHYKRFKNSCKLCKFDSFSENYDYKKFLDLLKQLMKLNNIKQDVYIRVSQVITENQIGPKFGAYKNDLVLFLYPLGDYVPTQGMRCKVSSWKRLEDNAITPRAKVNGAYVNTAFAKSEALALGYDEAIVLDHQGHVVEGSAENIFMVRDKKLITPPVFSNILEGVTRNSIIKIASDLGIEVIEREIDRTELYIADEIFLTGTGAKVSPVIKVDDYKVGKGKVGEISDKLQKMYFDIVKGKIEKYEDWVEEV